MTSLLIAYPDVPANTLWYSSTQTYDSDYWTENAFYGERHSYAQLAANQTSVSITFDLGYGNSRTVDHFILGGAYALYSNSVTQATLAGSNDDSTYVSQLGTAAGFQTRTFSGPDSKDLVFTAAFNDQYAATLAAYRYFKVTLAGGTHKFPVSKIYFGAFFDMGREPDFFDVVTVSDDVDTWRYARGHVLMTKSTHARHRVRLEWDGISDTLAASFASKILANTFRNTLFLYTTTYLDPLFDKRSLHVRVIQDSSSITQVRQNWNNIVLETEELV